MFIGLESELIFCNYLFFALPSQLLLSVIVNGLLGPHKYSIVPPGLCWQKPCAFGEFNQTVAVCGRGGLTKQQSSLQVEVLLLLQQYYHKKIITKTSLVCYC